MADFKHYLLLLTLLVAGILAGGISYPLFIVGHPIPAAAAGIAFVALMCAMLRHLLGRRKNKLEPTGPFAPDGSRRCPDVLFNDGRDAGRCPACGWKYFFGFAQYEYRDVWRCARCGKLSQWDVFGMHLLKDAPGVAKEAEHE